MLIGFVLGPMLEENFRRAMLFSRGDYSTFVTQPVSAVLLAMAALLLVWAMVSSFRQRSRMRNETNGL